MKRRGLSDIVQEKIAQSKAASVCSFEYSGFIQPKWEPTYLNRLANDPNMTSF